MGFAARLNPSHGHAPGERMGCVAMGVAACGLLLAAAGAQAQTEPEPEPEPAPLSLSTAGPMTIATLATTEQAPRLPKVDLALLMPSPMLHGSRPLDPVQMLQQAQGVRHDDSLSLGLRWRPQLTAGHTLDISVWRQVTPVPSLTGVLSRDPGYGAQVELQLASERMAALRDLVGFKFSNGARISLRRKSGQTTINFRMQF
ncbi:MAG: hypothetical protein V4609_03750 [Pseudomonadota bacterium]